MTQFQNLPRKEKVKIYFRTMARCLRQINSDWYKEGTDKEMQKEDRKMLDFFHRLYKSLPKTKEELLKRMESELGTDPCLSSPACVYLMTQIVYLSDYLEN